MLGLRTPEKGPEDPVHLADNVGIVDHDVSVDAANNPYKDQNEKEVAMLRHPKPHSLSLSADLRIVVMRTVTSWRTL